jgi:hypothetical protein
MQWLRHAFAIDKEGPAEPDLQQRAVIDRVCVEVVRRRMATPALLFLEMSRPLNYAASQAMHFFAPLLAVVADTKGYQQFAVFLEQRGSVDFLCRRIQQLESEHGGTAAGSEVHGGCGGGHGSDTDTP